jgi:hypothetical protein
LPKQSAPIVPSSLTKKERIAREKIGGLVRRSQDNSNVREGAAEMTDSSYSFSDSDLGAWGDVDDKPEAIDCRDPRANCPSTGHESFSTPCQLGNFPTGNGRGGWSCSNPGTLLNHCPHPRTTRT